MPLADILLYGRWLSEKAAREYIRKGEVAIIRSRGLLRVEDGARNDQCLETLSSRFLSKRGGFPSFGSCHR